MNPKDGDKIVVWFSCGAASAVAALKTIEKYGARCDVKVVNIPIKNEHEDNQRFLKDVESWLGVKIDRIASKKYPDADIEKVFEKQKFMSSPFGAPCTKELKKEVRYLYESINNPQWMVLGFTSEEKSRYERFIKQERDNCLPILIESNLSKKDCFSIITNAGIKLPKIYDLGYPNANCIGCVKSTSPDYWNLVRHTFPEVFKSRAEQSRKIGCRLVRLKGKRIFLDELPDMPVKKSLKIETDCGIFCKPK